MLNKIIENFKNINVLVIGDIMLDKYIFGDVDRISPEAPIQVLAVKKEKNVPGGAGNVANNIISMGANATIIGIVGNDESKDILISLMKDKCINCDGIVVDNSISTIQKIRVIARNQQIIRLDIEVKQNNKEIEICKNISKYINDCDIVVISDYAKGVVTPIVMQHLFKEALEHNKKVLVDPKPVNKELYKGAYLIKPNKLEFEELTGIKSDNFVIEGQKLVKEYDTNIILTLGEKGLLVFDKTKKDPISIPTQAKEVYDVSGAGDTVMATIALSIASGASLVDSVMIAAHAAAIVIGKVGTATTSIYELNNLLTNEENKLINISKLKDILKDKYHKKIVFTNGFFNILNIGHVQMLKKAKSFGDILIVAINTDESLRIIMGNKEPIVSQQDRAEMLASLECVDYLIFFDETELYSIINDLKPNIYVLGCDSDYADYEKMFSSKILPVHSEMKLIKIDKDKSISKTINNTTKKVL